MKWLGNRITSRTKKRSRQKQDDQEESVWLDQVRMGGQKAQDAFERLYDRHSESIWFYIRSRVSPSVDAEDVFQKTALRLFQYLQVDTPTRFIPIAMQTAKWEIANHFRNRPGKDYEVLSLDQLLELNQDPIAPQRKDASESLLSFRIEAQKAGLSDIQIESLVLFYFIGFSMKEVAQITNVSENVVQSRMRLAKLKLRGLPRPEHKK